jgi:hypothetical protein
MTKAGEDLFKGHHLQELLDAQQFAPQKNKLLLVLLAPAEEFADLGVDKFNPMSGELLVFMYLVASCVGWGGVTYFSRASSSVLTSVCPSVVPEGTAELKLGPMVGAVGSGRGRNTESTKSTIVGRRWW